MFGIVHVALAQAAIYALPPIPPPAGPALEPQRGRERPPLVVNSPDAWLSLNDYPAAARAERREGVSVVRLTISTRGTVSGCTVERSSGHADLDDAACRAVASRAQFEPARNFFGQRVERPVLTSIRWQVPAADTSAATLAITTE